MTGQPHFGIAAFLCATLAACAGGVDTDASSSPGAEPSGEPPAGAADSGHPDATAIPDAGGGFDASAGDASSAGDGATAPAPTTASACFQSLIGPVVGPNYDQFHPIIHPSCAGTHHQDIARVERLVFLGDSVTEGTPPNLPTQIFRTLVAEDVAKRFGTVDVADCAKWGARMDDLLIGQGEIAKCFPNAVEPKRTLVVMTMGGNDIAAWAKDALDTTAAIAQADASAALFRDAMTWLKDPARFPNGIDVVVANPYEYTDTSGDLLSCPAASLAGFKGNWPQGAPAIVHYQEQIMKVVVDTKIDMIFLLEHFCGHGYRRNDPSLQCYRGPNAELWFDLTCIHPNPTGHQQIADLFGKVIHG